MNVTETNAYASKKSSLVWQAQPLLLEDQLGACNDVGIAGGTGSFRAIWGQANANDSTDSNADRIWISGEF